MKKFLLLFLFIYMAKVNAQVTFQQTYGTTQNETINSTEITLDKGFISAGQKMYTTALNTLYGYLQKTDSLGNLQWVKKYTLPGFGYFENCVLTKDKGYIISGNARDSNV